MTYVCVDTTYYYFTEIASIKKNKTSDKIEYNYIREFGRI